MALRAEARRWTFVVEERKLVLDWDSGKSRLTAQRFQKTSIVDYVVGARAMPNTRPWSPNAADLCRLSLLVVLTFLRRNAGSRVFPAGQVMPMRTALRIGKVAPNVFAGSPVRTAGVGRGAWR